MTAHAPRGATSAPGSVHRDPHVVREAQAGAQTIDLDATIPCQWDAQECAIPATKAARTTCPTCVITRTYCGAHAGKITRLLVGPRQCRTCGVRLDPPYVEWRDL